MSEREEDKVSKHGRERHERGENEGLPTMTKLRQFTLYSCATNDVPVRGVGMLPVTRVRSVR